MTSSRFSSRQIGKLYTKLKTEQLVILSGDDGVIAGTETCDDESIENADIKDDAAIVVQ